jgi:microcystin-dependent protein
MSFAVNVNPDITNDITYYLKNKALDRTTTNIGDLKWSAINRDSYGWLICDGRSLSRAQYHDLYDVIGTTFGSVDADSFNIPDCRGRVLGAIGHGSGLSNRTAGQNVGEETHTLTIPEIPSHNHGGTTSDTALTINPSTVVTSVSSNTFRSTTSAGLSWDVVSSVSSATSATSISPNPHHHLISSQGGDQPHNNMQPTLFIGNVMIFGGYQYNL